MLVANRTAARHWQNVRADASAIAQIIRVRDVADELIHAAEMEQNGRVTNDEEAVDDVEVEYESGEAAEAQRVARPPFPGETITTEGESTHDEEEDSAAQLELGLAPEAPVPTSPLEADTADQATAVEVVL